MIARTLLVLALAGQAAALAQSPQMCPWLTGGTAAMTLGADVTISAHADSNWSGSCRFVTSTAPAASIEILIGNTDTHPCGAGATPLTAIGNRAELCSSRDSLGRDIQTVTGRVRGVWFVVTLAMRQASGQHARPHEELSAPPEIEFLAEQVTGNLY
jgi:hypothetical protein